MPKEIIEPPAYKSKETRRELEHNAIEYDEEVLDKKDKKKKKPKNDVVIDEERQYVTPE